MQLETRPWKSCAKHQAMACEPSVIRRRYRAGSQITSFSWRSSPRRPARHWADDRDAMTQTRRLLFAAVGGLVVTGTMSPRAFASGHLPDSPLILVAILWRIFPVLAACLIGLGIVLAIATHVVRFAIRRRRRSTGDRKKEEIGR